MKSCVLHQSIPLALAGGYTGKRQHLVTTRLFHYLYTPSRYKRNIIPMQGSKKLFHECKTGLSLEILDKLQCL